MKNYRKQISFSNNFHLTLFIHEYPKQIPAKSHSNARSIFWSHSIEGKTTISIID